MKLIHLLTATAIAVAVASVAHVHGQQRGEGSTAPVAVACAVDAVQAKAPAGTTIASARIVDATGRQPRHCQVDGRVAVPGNEVNFRVGLPENWNGKFLFIGVGGLGGTLGNLRTGLERGYATATTDTGHLSTDP